MDIFINARETEILIDALDTYGVKSQEEIAIEEMSELVKALIKNRRYTSEETRADILEEIADVEIMLMQLILVYGNPLEIITEKLERLKQRVSETKRAAFEETNRNILEYFACKGVEANEQ